MYIIIKVIIKGKGLIQQKVSKEKKDKSSRNILFKKLKNQKSIRYSLYFFNLTSEHVSKYFIIWYTFNRFQRGFKNNFNIYKIYKYFDIKNLK